VTLQRGEGVGGPDRRSHGHVRLLRGIQGGRLGFAAAVGPACARAGRDALIVPANAIARRFRRGRFLTERFEPPASAAEHGRRVDVAENRPSGRPAWMEAPSLPEQIVKGVFSGLIANGLMIFKFVYGDRRQASIGAGCAGRRLILGRDNPSREAYARASEGRPRRAARSRWPGLGNLRERPPR